MKAKDYVIIHKKNIADKIASLQMIGANGVARQLQTVLEESKELEPLIEDAFDAGRENEDWYLSKKQYLNKEI